MYHVDVFNLGEQAFKITSKDAEFVVDTKGKGITPPDALLASLGSCIGVYIRKYAESSKLDLGNFSLTVDAELSKDPPVAFQEIKVSLDLKGLVIDERRKKALLDFVDNCPVHNTLRVYPRVEIKII